MLRATASVILVTLFVAGELSDSIAAAPSTTNTNTTSRRTQTSSRSNTHRQQADRSRTVITTPAPIQLKRLSKCLLNTLAARNNLTVAVTMSEMGPAHDRTYTARLMLGTEEYTGSGKSKPEAEEAASSEAYAKTKQKKPDMGPRACVVGEKSAINKLQELVVNHNYTLSYLIEVDMGPPKTYATECHVVEPNLITRFNSTSKKTSKLEAAKLMLSRMGELRIVHDPARRYNHTDMHDMHPVQRLNEILAARHEPDAAYIEMAKLPDGTFCVKMSTDKFTAVGTGRTLQEAKREAAQNLLHEMKFTVT